ncbi:Metallo-dependent phosphatase-like protein, partial [Baffinella frigidus]
AANEVTLLHFNDVYEVQSRVREPVGGVARFIEKLRQYPDAVTLFSGDALAPSLLSTVTKGEHMVKFLNMMNIRAACMGNHDFDFGVEHLRDWCLPESNFPWLLSNAWHTDSGELLAGGRRSLVIEHRGRRLGVMGLIEEEWLATLATLERDEVIYRDYVEVAKEIVAELHQQGTPPPRVDCVIALTHMRKPNDRRLAEHVPELDLILGGHDHEVYSEVVNGVPIIKSGTDFRDLTRLSLQVGAAGGGVRNRPRVSWEHEEVTSDIGECAEASALVHVYSDALAKSMEKVLGELGCSMDARFEHIRTRETNCGNWVSDCVRDGVENSGIHVDVVLINSGTLRADDVFPPGPFLMRDLVTLLPMLDELAVIALTGEQMVEALENGVSMFPKLEGRFPCVSGIKFEFSPSLPAGNRVIRDTVVVNGVAIELEKEYNLVTKAYLASGRDGYEVFQKGRMVRDGEGSPLLADIIRAQFAAI